MLNKQQGGWADQLYDNDDDDHDDDHVIFITFCLTPTGASASSSAGVLLVCRLCAASSHFIHYIQHIHVHAHTRYTFSI